MKAKSLLLAGAIAVAGAFSASAQSVFSVNAVGFVNKTFNPGFTLVANPLVAADNSVQTLFDAAPNGTQLFKFNAGNGSFDIATRSILGWNNGTLQLLPGEAVFVNNTTASPFTITFVGNVNQGSLTNALIAGFNMISSQVPQAGLAETDLGLPVSNGEAVFRFTGSGYNIFSKSILGWNPEEPQIDVGEGFWINKIASVNWTRNFDVNNP